MMIRDRIRKELMSAHKPPIVPPEVEEPPVWESTATLASTLGFPQFENLGFQCSK
jgi:hypothetical protein